MVFIQFWKTVFIYHDFIHISFSYIIINFNCKYEKKTPNNFDCIVFTTFLSTTAIVEAAIAPHRLLLTILKVPGSFLCDLSGMIVCTSTTPRSFSTSSSLEELQGQKFSEAYYIVWFLFGVWRTALTTFFFCAQVICRWHIIVIVIVDK